MAKAVLVMELDEFPKNCSNCPQEWESDCSGRAFCAGTGDSQHEIDGDDWNVRPDWCPLIPEPKRQLNSAQHVIGESQKTGKDLKLITGYHLGWNACIDYLEDNNGTYK